MERGLAVDGNGVASGRGWRLALALTLLLLVAFHGAVRPADAAVSRIKDIADFESVRDNMLVGYGLVVGLAGTGDSLRNSAFTEESLKSMLERLGVSTRGTLTLLAIARAYALAEGRNFVSPDDIKALYQPVLAHRIAVTPEAELDGITEAEVLDGIVDSLPVPRARQATAAPA